MYILAPWWFYFFYPLTPHLVKEVDNDIVFLDAQAVEVLSHDIRQLVTGLSPEFSASCDCRGVEPDASWLSQHPFMVVADESGRSPEAVGSSVGMENVSIKRRPL